MLTTLICCTDQQPTKIRFCRPCLTLPAGVHWLVPPVTCCAALADLIQAGTPGSIAAGVIIFVLACMGFIVTGIWIVFSNVHRNNSRKAHWVVPTIDMSDDVRAAGMDTELTWHWRMILR